ncbi:MAG: serine/threonine protein kinase [Leptolyngbya sp.]|nr:serine/threonine protein kinase [Candidatus Melainabacteria bacterium]
MQNPHKPNDLVRTDGKVRLTTADEALKEVVSDSSIGSDFGLDQSHPSYRDRLLNTGTDTQNETSSKSRSATQSETREKTQSGELASLEHTHDPDGTMGCNTCQQDLSEAIKDHCQIKIGDVIASRYEIRKYLGEGGMSAVYAAFDKVIKREVALKILHRDLLIKGKGSLLRFQREAQALGNLDHPNIVKIHHFDADENAQPFIVMDIVQGEPLARRIVKQLDSLKFDDIIEIFLQVCDALSHAHERGVVHRDLKPSNIMVLGNTVKVLDFGIAKLMSEDSDQELQLTRTGEVFGSPLYMSPEQCRGQKLDIRSDIYSVGCVMFEAFTGSPPFTGNSHIDTMLKHVNDLPPSVASTMSDAKHAEKVDAILLRCLAKRPADRFQSMAEIKAALLSLDQEISGGIVGRLRQRLELMRLKMGAQDKLTKKMIAAYCAAGVIFAGLGTTALVQHNNSTARNFSAAFKDANLAHWKEIDQSGQAEVDAGNFEKAMDLFCLDLAMAKQLNKPELQFASLQQIIDLLVAKEFLHSDLRGNSDYQKQLKIYRGQMSEILANENKDVRGLVGEITNADSLSPIERTEIINRGLDSAQAFYDAGKTRDCMEILDKIFLLKTLDRDLALSGRAHFIRGLCFDRQMQTLEAREHYSIALKHREKVLPTLLPRPGTVPAGTPLKP